MKGLYYFVKRIYQLNQTLPLFNKLGGKIINIIEFPTSYLYFTFKYGFSHTKLMANSLRNLDRVAKGLILCHSADDTVPEGKNYRRVFVYHGTSDKVFTLEDRRIDIRWFEYYFITGPKDLYKLKMYSRNPEFLDERIIKIGAFRSDAIINRTYNRDKILEKYGIKPGSKRIILYAPTWTWGGGTLRRCFEDFAEKITREYVLIVRPHTNDWSNIPYIHKWQRRNRVKNLYIFSKQYHDIMDFIHISDLMIGDNSAVNYDYAFTGKPIVIVKTHSDDVFTPPDEYNIKLCAPIFDPDRDNIMHTIEEAFSNKKYVKCLSNLVENSFYFNDGHAVDRACSFIVDELDRMGIIDKNEIIRQMSNIFTYIPNYR